MCLRGGQISGAVGEPYNGGVSYNEAGREDYISGSISRGRSGIKEEHMLCGSVWQ